MEHNPTFYSPINTGFCTGILQRNKENEHRDVKKNKVASLTDVATFNVFDVEVGLFLAFSSIRVLPTPDKRARQRNKGVAENHTKSLVSNMSINLRKILVRYHYKS